MSEQFNAWLAIVRCMFTLEPIKLEPISTRGCKQSHIGSIASKSALNTSSVVCVAPQNERQPIVLEAAAGLVDRARIYLSDMKQRRWSWDLDKITELEISESVLALLMSDIKRLPSDLQFGLQVAACIRFMCN